MDFKDWRKTAAQPALEKDVAANKYHGKRFSDHIEEQLHEAQERGLFDNLQGLGQPLKLDVNDFAGEKALGYSLLKSNGFAPAEVELSGEIRQDLERLDNSRIALSKRRQELRQGLVAPSASEKRAYNHAVAKALIAREAKLRDLNRKILTLNLSTPGSMHHVPLDVEALLSQFRETCPLIN